MAHGSPFFDFRERLFERDLRPHLNGSKQISALCPAHEDKNPSLSAGEAPDGKVLVHCHAGCATDDILRALDLDYRDLYPPSNETVPSGIRRASYRSAVDGWKSDAAPDIKGRKTGAKPDITSPEPDRPSSWEPMSLDDIIDSGAPAKQPELLARTDGVFLVYLSLLTWFQGLAESMKTWVAANGITEQLHQGHHCLLIDFEMGPIAAVQRLLALGTGTQALREQLHYVSPTEPPTDDDWRALWAAIGHDLTLVVLDSVNAAMSTFGLDPVNNRDAGIFKNQILNPLLATGAAVVVLDHLPKDPEAAKRGPIGAVTKQNVADVTYTFQIREAPAIGRAGYATIKVTKDRYGAIRQHEQPGTKVIAEAHLIPQPDEHVTIELRPPRDVSGFRPTAMMEKVSRLVEQTGSSGASKNVIEGTLSGRSTTIRKAIEVLVDEGYMTREQGARGAFIHRSVNPYLEDEDPLA